MADGPVHRVRNSLCILLSALMLLTGGCVTTETLRPDAIAPDESRDMQVYTRDRRTIEFPGGKYAVVDSGGAYFLRGNGIEFQVDSAATRVPFSGVIPFGNIEKIETRETDVYSMVYVTLFIGFFAVIGFGTNLTN